MKQYLLPIIAAVSLTLTACGDHDNPELMPIDTTKVAITADVTVSPQTAWLNPTEEITVSVRNVTMDAPAGLVLRNIILSANDREISSKPFDGKPLEFKVPLNQVGIGRINFAVRGELIRQGCRDAEILIADNIQRIVFSDTPAFECRGAVNITVTAQSTSGEEYARTFTVYSTDHFTIPVPQTELYWIPDNGTASTLSLKLSGGATAWSTNSTLVCTPSKIYWGGRFDDGEVTTIDISNTPGSLDKAAMTMYVNTVESGTFENVTVSPANMLYTFELRETAE